LRKYSNNKGFSLIELIVALAIALIVGGSIISFLLTGSNSYNFVVTNTDLQEEAQLVMNQISDIVATAEKAVNFDDLTGTLEVFNEKEKYEIRFDNAEKRLYYKKRDRDITNNTFSVVEDVLMAENVSGFWGDMTNVATTSKVSVQINFENKSSAYVKEETISLRNGKTVIPSNDVTKIYNP